MAVFAPMAPVSLIVALAAAVRVVEEAAAPLAVVVAVVRAVVVAVVRIHVVRTVNVRMDLSALMELAYP